MANAEYTSRIDRVIDHVRANLDSRLRLDELARIARFSPFHFHRVFRAVTGETVSHFVSRQRLERAARELRRTSDSATLIALRCGFSSSAVFSRSFRSAYGVSPSRYRASGKFDRKIRKALVPRRKYAIAMSRAQKRAAFPVRIRTFPAWDVAYVRVANAYEGDRALNAFRRLVLWATHRRVLDTGTLFGMSADDASVTPKRLYRYEACLAGPLPSSCPPGISRTSLPARTCAVTRVRGDILRVGAAWNYLFDGWLINSGYEPENAPAFEIFLNKDRALDWSSFELDLCLPVKPLHA